MPDDNNAGDSYTEWTQRILNNESGWPGNPPPLTPEAIAQVKEELGQVRRRQQAPLGYRYKMATIPLAMAEAIIAAHPEMAELIRINEGNRASQLLASAGSHVVEDEQVAEMQRPSPQPGGGFAIAGDSRRWFVGNDASTDHSRNSERHPGQQRLPMDVSAVINGIPVQTTEHLPGDTAVLWSSPDGERIVFTPAVGDDTPYRLA